MIQEAIISSHKNGDIAIDIMFVNAKDIKDPLKKEQEQHMLNCHL